MFEIYYSIKSFKWFYYRLFIKRLNLKKKNYEIELNLAITKASISSKDLTPFISS